MEKIEYPIRLNHYLALQNIASRREADKLIEAGKVRLNGKIAQLGDKVNEGDTVEVDQKTIAKRQREFIYLAFNKPVGIVSNEEEGQQAIVNLLKTKTKVYPLGRLDKDSSGLILLTNDGRVTKKLLDPEYNHEKEYRVKVDKKLTPMFQKAITSGVPLEDGVTKPCRLEKIDSDEFLLTLTEGKKHQIRRMCAALGYQIKELERVRIMNIKLGNLKPGRERQLTDKEQQNFLAKLGL